MWILLAFAASGSTVSAQSCAAPSGWFPHATTPKPSDTIGGNENCDFHRWSWQMFLWVSQTVDGDPRFLAEMFSPEQVFNQGFFFEQALPAQATDKRMLRLRPRDVKPPSARGIVITESGGGVNQAGDNGILVDQRGRAVYYATHLNDVYSQFIKDRKYNNPLNLPSADPTDNFPVGTLMLKSSWRVLAKDEDSTGFYTRDAQIEQLNTDDDGHVVVDVNNVVPGRVALVGLHVVGRVVQHPEFVWATFEHRANAPLLPSGMSPASSARVSASNATFYASGTAARDCNKSHAKQVKLDDKTQILSPITQVFRQVARGGGMDVDTIGSLNDSVRKGLGQDVWSNYELIGSVWNGKPDALEPNSIPEDQQGSVRLSNSTMETFRQSIGNCFDCHNTRGYDDAGKGGMVGPKNINLSHATRQVFVQTFLEKPLAAPAKKLP